MLSILEERKDLNAGTINSTIDYTEREFVAVIKRCSCGSPWCKTCRKKKFQKSVKPKLDLMDWRSVRHVTLTVDRNQFANGREAYEQIQNSHKISNFIRNLQVGNKQFPGIPIKNWVWVLEWHRDGFPHWHLIIETKAGKDGQLGQDRIHYYWNYAKIIHETYFKSEKKWQDFAGYACKVGYLEKKKEHQAFLPEWALDSDIKIRKSGAKKLPSNNPNVEKKPSKVSPRKAYRLIIQKCGESCICAVISRSDCNDPTMVFYLKRPYQEVISRLTGQFIPGYGFCADMSVSVLDDWLTCYRGVIKINKNRRDQNYVYH